MPGPKVPAEAASVQLSPGPVVLPVSIVECPEADCRRHLLMYDGDNPHKSGTGWCATHGRVVLKE